MIHSLLAWFIVLHAIPVPAVSWISDNDIRIKVEGREELLDRCLEGGVEVRYRYEMRYCTRGKYWFDDCESEIVEIRSLSFNPLKETYRLESDRLGDEVSPVISSYSSRSQALENLATIESIPLAEIAKGRKLKENDRDYVNVRVVSDCKGSVGGVLLDMSHFMSLGLIKINRFDSGWIAFFLNRQ